MRPFEFYAAFRRRQCDLFLYGICCLVICAIAMSGMIAGCAARQKNVTNLPPGVTLTQVQQWDAAIADLDKIASASSVLRQAVIALNGASVTDSTGTHKVIPDGATYAAILTSLGKADQAQIAAAAFLKAYPNTWNASLAATLKGYMGDISAALQSIITTQLAGIKNAGAQSQIQQLIVGVTNAVNLVLTLTTV